MKEIQLTQGKTTQVDNWNYEWLNQWNWQAHKSRNTYYAARRVGNKLIAMHRLILNTPPNLKGDHRDHDGLNNQEYNLRNCTNSQNGMNRTPGGKSKYLGVKICLNRKNSFTAHIRINGINTYIGYFRDEIQAAIAYDNAAKIHHGEFANLNFKTGCFHSSSLPDYIEDKKSGGQQQSNLFPVSAGNDLRMSTMRPNPYLSIGIEMRKCKFRGIFQLFSRTN